MVAHDNFAGKDTQPVNFKKGKDGRPIPDEPQFSFPEEIEQKEGAVPLGSVRGGTTRPVSGASGDVEQLDNDGNVTKLHPGAVAQELKDNGPEAAGKLLEKGK